MPHTLTKRNIDEKPSHPKSILIGEDDIDDEELLREVFSSVDTDLTIHFTNNGKKLLEFLEAASHGTLPCLIVLDYNMPELNGGDILKELKDQPKYAAIPKIIWSTSRSETYRKKCLELGAADYIIKPSKVSELVETVNYMLSFC